MIVSGLLMIAGGLIAAVGIENPRRRVEAVAGEVGASPAAG
jgi:hypothetical protein